MKYITIIVTILALSMGSADAEDGVTLNCSKKVIITNNELDKYFNYGETLTIKQESGIVEWMHPKWESPQIYEIIENNKNTIMAARKKVTKIHNSIQTLLIIKKTLKGMKTLIFSNNKDGEWVGSAARTSYLSCTRPL